MSLFHERLNEIYQEKVSQAEKEHKKYPVKDFAAEAGMTRQAMAKYLDGYSANKKGKSPGLPDLPMFERLCNTFSVSADWLLGLSDVRTPDTGTIAVCKKTGLSEESVSVLASEEKLLNEEYPGIPNKIALTIDTLLKNKDLLQLIFTYLYDDHKSLKVLSDDGKETVSAEKIVGYNLPDFERLARISLLDAFSDFRKTLDFERQQFNEENPFADTTDESKKKNVQLENELVQRRKNRKAESQLIKKGEEANGNT